MAGQFLLPDLGEGIHEAQIIRVLVKAGDEVTIDQPLMEVETDKAAVEIPSPYAGLVTKVHVEEGQTVNVGVALVTFDDAGAAAEQPVVVAQPQAPAPPGQPVPRAAATGGMAEPAPAKTGRPAKVAASPAVRRLAKERGIDLASITGSGSGGRVTRQDIEDASAGVAAPVAPTASPAPAGAMPPVTDLPDFSQWGPIRVEPISLIRKTIANHMVRSEATNVHVTHHDMADIQMLEQLRKDYNGRLREGEARLTLLPFVIKAAYAAMRQYPVFNSSFDHAGQAIVYKDYHHFGIAVDTPRGLVVPVIRDVDKKSMRELAEELAALGQKARDTSFKIEELRGGTFTITNIGSLGGIVSTPIINYPEVAILGLGKADMRAVVRDGAVVARYIIPLNLSFDHRVIDGADAARFATEVIRYLEVPGRLLLEE